MGFSVWVITGRGRAEEVARGRTAEEAESIARHPSLHGHRVVVVPTWSTAAVDQV
jgi:hypothetical protein